jgi:O-methyltransferase
LELTKMNVRQMFRSGKRTLRRIVFNGKFDGRAAFDFKMFKKYFPDISYEDAALIHRFDHLTMTGVLRQAALLQAIRYLNERAIGGDIVECGVWRGGAMLLAKALCETSPVRRNFYLFDTFAGMSAPTEADITRDGKSAVQLYGQYQKPTHSEWCYASLDDVRENFRSNGLLDSSVNFVKGKVEETLRDPKNLPASIALLRLDTDFYESTRAEFEVLYPRLVSGGVLIIDDYGHWQGARKATDEYFQGSRPLLVRLDSTARLAVKA